MRLTDLSPRWASPLNWNLPLREEPFWIGVTFLCPCGCAERRAVQFANPIDPTGLIGRLFDVWGAPTGELRWQRSGETFDTLSLTPSISQGHWHGTITNGEVTPA